MSIYNNIATDIKRFYKNVTITQGSQGYEISLDQRKLKTPGGNLFLVPTEGLALAVQNEWDSQEETIKKYNMHIVRFKGSNEYMLNFLFYFRHLYATYQLIIRRTGKRKQLSMVC